MHHGNIHNPRTASARVYGLLLALSGEWASGWYLTTTGRTTAISTRISEVRRQLPTGERIDHSPMPTPEHERGSWYRLVRAPKQLTFQLPIESAVGEG